MNLGLRNSSQDLNKSFIESERDTHVRMIRTLESLKKLRQKELINMKSPSPEAQQNLIDELHINYHKGSIAGIRQEKTSGFRQELEHAQEITRLRQELEQAQEKITGLSQELELVYGKVTGLSQELEQAEEKIAGLSQELKQAIKINKELITQISSNNEKNVNLVKELNNKQNQFQVITIQHQLENIDENSMKIEVDEQQFRQNHQLNYNKVNNIEEGGIKNIINIIEDIKDLLQKGEQGIDEYKKILEQNLEKQNDQVKEKTMELLMKLEKNRICFIYIRKVFEQIPNVFKEFGAINQELLSNIQVLEDHVKILEGKNKIFEKRVEILLKELDKQNNQEKQLIADQENKYNYSLSERLEISNKYAELYKGFIDETRVNINNMVCKNFQFFLQWNQDSCSDEHLELIESIRSFITSLQESNIKNESDSIEYQMKRSQDLFQQIQSRVNSNSIVKQYNIQNIELTLAMRQTLLDYKKKIDLNMINIENLEGLY